MDSTKKQPLVILEADYSDAREILEMQIAAFTKPFEPVFFQWFPLDEDREKSTKRMVSWWQNDPTAKYMKVVDTETGKIISAAKWCIHKDPPTESQMNEKLKVDWLPDEDSSDWAEQVWSFLHQEQMAVSKDGGCCVIDMLSTHPEHERRGAGSMLLKWGTDLADSLGFKAFVQASRRGKNLYEKFGFVDREGWVKVPVTERHKNRPPCGWFNLDRPAKV